MRTAIQSVSACLCLFAFGLPSFGQVGSQAAILGVVKDSTGAVIPGARIEVANTATGLRKAATADEGGNFEILALPIGSYSLSVSTKGFKTWNIPSLELTVGERSRIFPVLELGEVSEKVTVEGSVELIQADKSSVEGLVGQRQIRDLPLNGRNPVQLVALVPGMRYESQTGPERGSSVQGLGIRDYYTEFQLDGLNANAGKDETGIGIPNVDTIAEFSVQTNSFSAENGRNPVQVIMVTKSGTNEYHGTLWEFLRNDALDARNTFATIKPTLRRNQFGGTTGGHIIKNKTFFFGSFEGTLIRQQTIYNSVVLQPQMLQGNFSALNKSIKDPLTGQPFPGNIIPQSRFSSAAKFLFPYVLLPNSADGRFHANAPNPENTFEYDGRIDHQITNNQRIFGRLIYNHDSANPPQYEPDMIRYTITTQHNAGFNYTYTITPSTLLTAGFGYMHEANTADNPLAGKENLDNEAGIQGFQTAGREAFIGLPTVNITAYTGFGLPNQVPLRQWMWTADAKVAMNLIRGGHSINFGFEYNNRSVYGTHGSNNVRGTFNFNGQYTGDGAADYLLGLVSSTARNYPLAVFGLAGFPYDALYLQDFWKIHPNLTLNLGVRYDRWGDRTFVNGNGSTFSIPLGKAVAAEENGQVNLTAQPVAQYLAAAFPNLWVPASQAGMNSGLYQPNGHFSPRVGAAWRPLSKDTLVLRAGYGIFQSGFRGNRSASSIVGLPYWTAESQTFSSLTLQPWETAWPVNPQNFVQPSVTEAEMWGLSSTKTHEWNISVEKSLPLQSALTLSYVGTRVYDLATLNPLNEVPPGKYANLQAAKPYPAFGVINLLENIGDVWYDALQVKWERRFAHGFSSTVSYVFSKNIGNKAPSSETAAPGFGTPWNPTAFAPNGYDRGRSDLDRTHMLTINSIYELPFGRGRKYMTKVRPLVNALLGGWQLSGIYSFSSGTPLTLALPGATLGNGWNTRPNLIGDPHVSSPNAREWFNPLAFQAPPAFAFGNSGMGILDGPGTHSLDAGLMKNFHATESKYLQVRWEVFNSINHVNLGLPDTNFGTATTGQILSAGNARQMQLGLKFIF
jgi:hypothetical protein